MEKGIKKFSQLTYSITILNTGSLLFLPQSEIGADKLLVDQGHLQEEHVGSPHHPYRRSHPCRPVVERGLQKIILLMTMAKNYVKQLSL